MKKHMFKSAALLLCVSLLVLSLCGCSLLERFGITLPDLPILQADKQTESTEYTLSGPTDFYQEPDRDSPLIATFYEGHTVVYSSVLTINGVQWASANEGWFILNGSSGEILESFPTEQDGIITEDVVVYSEPFFSAEAYAQLEAGALVHLSEIAATADGSWGLTSMGWIPLNDYFSMEDLQQQASYCVTRDDNVQFYDMPNPLYAAHTTVDSGVRLQLLIVIQAYDAYWGYTESGWVQMGAVYEEGTTGLRPCKAIVIDPTPLNVRLAPGTDNEILTTLTYGDPVTILEQVDRDGADWGYTGTGWIYMGLVEIQ